MPTVRFRAGLAVLLLLGIGTWLLGCRDKYRHEFEAKCDAALRLRVEELASKHPDSLLDVLGRATAAIDEGRQTRLKDAGAQVGTVTVELFTARIPVRRVPEVAALDFVSSLALAQTRAPLGS